MDISAYCVHIITDNFVNRCDIAVAVEFSVFIIMSRRKGRDLFTYLYKVFRLAGKHHCAIVGLSVIQRTYAYRVSCGYELMLITIIYNTGKFSIEQ